MSVTRAGGTAETRHHKTRTGTRRRPWVQTCVATGELKRPDKDDIWSRHLRVSGFPPRRDLSQVRRRLQPRVKNYQTVGGTDAVWMRTEVGWIRTGEVYALGSRGTGPVDHPRRVRKSTTKVGRTRTVGSGWRRPGSRHGKTESRRGVTNLRSGDVGRPHQTPGPGSLTARDDGPR